MSELATIDVYTSPVRHVRCRDCGTPIVLLRENAPNANVPFPWQPVNPNPPVLREEPDGERVIATIERKHLHFMTCAKRGQRSTPKNPQRSLFRRRGASR